MANDNEFIEKLTKGISEALKNGLSEGIGLAEVARNEAAKLINEKKRGFVPQAACMKCRQPVNVCGGPEMKRIQVAKDGKLQFDKDSNPVWEKDDNGRDKLVQATGDREPDANHVLMVVDVGDRDASKYLTYVVVNSVKYRSGRPGHKVLVPVHNDIQAILSNYEKTEIDQRQGKEVQYNSGSIGPGTGRSGFRPPRAQLARRSFV